MIGHHLTPCDVYEMSIESQNAAVLCIHVYLSNEMSRNRGLIMCCGRVILLNGGPNSTTYRHFSLHQEMLNIRGSSSWLAPMTSFTTVTVTTGGPGT